MTIPQIVALAVFIVVMIFIATEKAHRTAVSLAGAVFLVITGIVPVDNVVNHIDFNTIGVLVGMMLFVSIARETGLFEYIAIKAAKIAKADPWRLLIAFVIVTFVLSAMLDNVTTVLLVGPMTLTVCELMKINPIPYFLAEIMASNIGGTSTLIGDPPNIMIGSRAGLDFLDFIEINGPITVIIMAVFLVIFYFLFAKRPDMKAGERHRDRIMLLDENEAIKNSKVFKQSVVMIVLIAIAFALHGTLGIESSAIALAAAAILMLISQCDVEKAMLGVEWTTIGFFMALFVIVGALSETGLITTIATWLTNVTAGNTVVTMLVLLWASALISSILDNIPFVATLIPIIITMQSQGIDVVPLWWAISLGACLGGNGTLIGASANVVLSGISTKAGYPITFASFTKYGFPMMLVSTVLATGYLLLRFAM